MTGPEIVQFSFSISQVFSSNALEKLLLGMARRLEDYVVALVPYPDQVVQLVARANSEGWIGQLVVAVVRDRGDTQVIQRFLRSNPHWDPATNPPLDEPYDTLRLFGGKCFIGRPGLRKFLKAMNTPTGRKVLLVTSDRRKVGKTYSKELLTFVSDKVVPIDLDQDDYNPGNLAARIAGLMGIEPALVPPQGQQQAARWNQELVEWLVPFVPDPAATTVWWIVLDGFRQKIPSEATQDFIAQLAQRIQGTQRFRLILINYTIRLPLTVGAFVFKDEVHPIEESEVHSFLSKLHERKYGAEPAEELILEHVKGLYKLVAQYRLEHPELVEDQLLINMAASDYAEII
jgi:hypothetical protein